MTAIPIVTGAVQAQDVVLDLLLPFWQVIIGGLVLLAIAASVRPLARRGFSRMTTGLLVSAGAIIALTVFGVLFQGR